MIWPISGPSSLGSLHVHPKLRQFAHRRPAEDVTLDGVVRYTGSGNDRDPILFNVGSTTPNNWRAQQIP